jgi:hypothetical protein
MNVLVITLVGERASMTTGSRYEMDWVCFCFLFFYNYYFFFFAGKIINVLCLKVVKVLIKGHDHDVDNNEYDGVNETLTVKKNKRVFSAYIYMLKLLFSLTGSLLQGEFSQSVLCGPSTYLLFMYIIKSFAMLLLKILTYFYNYLHVIT